MANETLTQAQREAICAWLLENSSDAVLVNSVNMVLNFRSATKNVLQTVSKTELAVKEATPPKKNPPPVVKKHNVEPPGADRQRVGNALVAKIKQSILEGADTVDEVSKEISLPEEDVASILKLLWKRDQVIFDGTRFEWIGG